MPPKNQKNQKVQEQPISKKQKNIPDPEFLQPQRGYGGFFKAGLFGNEKETLLKEFGELARLLIIKKFEQKQPRAQKTPEQQQKFEQWFKDQQEIEQYVMKWGPELSKDPVKAGQQVIKELQRPVTVKEGHKEDLSELLTTLYNKDDLLAGSYKDEKTVKKALEQLKNTKTLVKSKKSKVNLDSTMSTMSTLKNNQEENKEAVEEDYLTNLYEYESDEEPQISPADSKQKLLLEIVKEDQDQKTHLFDGQNEMMKQKNVPRSAVIGSIEERIQIIGAPSTRKMNPKLMTSFLVLLGYIKGRKQKETKQQALGESVGSKEEAKSLMGDTGNQSEAPTQETVPLKIVADKSVEKPASTLLINHLHSIINSSAPESNKTKARAVLGRISKSEKSSEQAENTLEQIKYPEHQDYNDPSSMQLATTTQRVTFNNHNMSLFDVTQLPSTERSIELTTKKYPDMTSQQIQQAYQYITNTLDSMQNIRSMPQWQLSGKVNSVEIERQAREAIKELQAQESNSGEAQASNGGLAKLEGPEEIEGGPRPNRPEGPKGPRPNRPEEPEGPREGARNIAVEKIYPTKEKAKSPIYTPLILPKGANQQTITMYDYFNYIGKAVEFISKISGDIQIQQGVNLLKYKTQTQVFTSKIVKEEPTQFSIAPGTAFKLRSCC